MSYCSRIMFIFFAGDVSLISAQYCKIFQETGGLYFFGKFGNDCFYFSQVFELCCIDHVTEQAVFGNDGHHLSHVFVQTVIGSIYIVHEKPDVLFLISILIPLNSRKFFIKNKKRKPFPFVHNLRQSNPAIVFMHTRYFTSLFTPVRLNVSEIRILIFKSYKRRQQE